MARDKDFIELFVDGDNVFDGIGDAAERIMDNYKTMLSDMLTGTKKAFEQIRKTLENQKATKTVLQQVVKLKRALMGFDELNRLSKSSVSTVSKTQEVAASAQEAAQKLSALTATVKEKVLQPFTKFVAGVFKDTGAGLEGLTGDAQRAAVSTGWLSTAWNVLNTSLGIWNGMVPVSGAMTGLLAEGIGKLTETSGAADGALKTLLESVGQIGTESEKSTNASAGAWSAMRETWSEAAGWFGANVALPMTGDISGLWSSMAPGASSAWENTKKVFGTAGSFFSETFGNAWERVKGVFKKDGEVFVDIQDGVLEGFKELVNGLIGGINSVVQLPFSGLNNTLKKLQSVKIGSVQPFKWLTWQADIPQIPKLAQGAVLPANKPFLAMVGDQRHGTNVEAPLSVIQEAVALVMEDYAASNMAGHEATVAVLREILEAVLGIHIGDDVIANAYDRYQRKTAAIRGG